MSVIKWDWNASIQIRACSATGSVLLTWQPVTTPPNDRTVPIVCGPILSEEETEMRQLISRELRPWVIGWRVKLPVVWLVSNWQVPGVAGTGLGYLHSVLSLAVGGAYLELTLNGSTWRRVAIERHTETNLDGINTGLRVEIEFVQTALKTSQPTQAAADW